MVKKLSQVRISLGVFLSLLLFSGCGSNSGLHKERGEGAGAVKSAASVRNVTDLDQASIRNATKKTIEYTIRPHGSEESSEKRRLDPMAVHAYPGSTAQDVTFSRAHSRITYKVKPGRPYVFRHNENGELELYPGSHGRSDAADLAPYVQTPYEVVEKMLELAHVDEADVVYDIGCGDGRIVIMAAQEFGARGVGIDIVPERIKEAESNAWEAGVSERVEFRLEDAAKSDISLATVVTLYLVPESNALLKPMFDTQLEPGTYVVSHDYPIPDWEEKLVNFLSYKTRQEAIHLIYVYRK